MITDIDARSLSPDPELLRAHKPVWIITERPVDYPERYCARLHFRAPGLIPTNLVITGPRPENLHALFTRAGLVYIQEVAGLKAPIIVGAYARGEDQG